MMRYCFNCGKELSEGATFCMSCGQDLRVEGERPHGYGEGPRPFYGEVPHQAHYYAPQQIDDANFGWAVLGFFFPVVALILYLVWKNERPKTARRVAKGGITGVIVGVAVPLLLYFLVVFIFLAAI